MITTSRFGTGVIAVGFLLLISLFLGPRIYWDHTLLIGNRHHYIDRSFAPLSGELFKQPRTNFLMDVDNSLQNYPFRYFTQASLRRGEIPWWNPYIGMGIPFVAIGAGVFDPVAAVAGVLTSPTKLPNALAVIALWIAAVGMFVFLGTLDVSQSARVFGAVVFTFSGWTIAWLGRQNFLVEIWMPWLFWTGARVIQTPSLRQVALLSLCVALIWLPGHPQTSLHVLIAFGVYILFLQRQRSIRRVRALGAVGVALVLGVSVGLVELVPITELLAQSQASSETRGVRLPATDAISALALGVRGDWTVERGAGPTALTMISPLFFGTPRTGSPASLLGSYWLPGLSFPETVMYAGLLPLFFALYGFARRRQIHGMGVWLALTVFALGVAYSLPVFNLINYLPPFDRINNARLRLVYRFALVVGAVLGLERFMRRYSGRGDRRPLKWLAGYAAIVLLLPAAAYFAFARHFFNIKPMSPLPPLGTLLIPAAVIVGAFGVAVGAGLPHRSGARLFKGAVVLIAFADLFWFFHDFNPAIPSKYVFPETPVIKRLKEDSSLFRVWSASRSGIMQPNTKLTHGFFDIELFSPLITNRYAALEATVGPRPRAGEPLHDFRFSDPVRYQGLIDLMNLKYLVMLPDVPGFLPDQFRRFPQYRLIYDREVRVYENLSVLPRAFLVTRALIFDTPAAVLDRVTRGDFDPRTAVLLEAAANPRLPPADAATAGGEIQIRSLTANDVALHTDLGQSAFLVLSEAYDPGWRATVDGRETPVYRADYLFRAIYLEPGSHEILFTFMPRSYALTVRLSAAAALIILAGLAGSGLAGLARRRSVRRA